MIEFATNEVEKANFLDKEKERKKLVAKKRGISARQGS